jgi:prephenate dehydrogenase
MAETINVLILGTATAGASIGLALQRAGANFNRIGYDPDPPTARQAQQTGAVDKVVSHPGGAAAGADLVLLNLSSAHALWAVEAVADRLKPDTVVLSTAGLRDTMMQGVRARLAPKNLCLGAVPFLGPHRALAPTEGVGEPAADMFEKGMLGIVAPPGTPEGAVQICMDLAAILGATPFFLEPAELDSLTATSEEVPSVLAAVLLESLEVNPGWRDQRRLVGRSFAQLAGLIERRAGGGWAEELIANRGPLIARLEALAQELESLRAMLASADEGGLTARLDRAAEIYRDWRSVRIESRPDHGVELPGVPRIDLFERLLGGRKRPVPK